MASRCDGVGGVARLAWPLVALLVVLLAGRAAVADGQADKAEEGHELYRLICETCHGPEMVNPGLLSFDLRKFPREDSARFRTAVTTGKGQAMPPLGDKLSDEDIDALWAYVRTGGAGSP